MKSVVVRCLLGIELCELDLPEVAAREMDVVRLDRGADRAEEERLADPDRVAVEDDLGGHRVEPRTAEIAGGGAGDGAPHHRIRILEERRLGEDGDRFGRAACEGVGDRAGQPRPLLELVVLDRGLEHVEDADRLLGEPVGDVELGQLQPRLRLCQRLFGSRGLDEQQVLLVAEDAGVLFVERGEVEIAAALLGIEADSHAARMVGGGER